MKSYCKTVIGDSRSMNEIEDCSVHLIVTSPPYFNAKHYDNNPANLGNISDYKQWEKEITKVWSECFRVLASGRRLFINIMNLPLKDRGKGFRTLNIIGHTIDICEKIGFTFKREIIWHKTNGVKAHFGTYPYPGGILVNNMHEQILEFQKSGKPDYSHLTREQREISKLDKDFWLGLKNTDVWLMKPYKSGSREHLAPFPEELPYRIIKGWSFVGETVLDPFAGMGTTGKVAIELNRNVILYEINDDYLPLIRRKIEEVHTLFTKNDFNEEEIFEKTGC